MYGLGLDYWNGWGVPKDLGQAQLWIGKATDLGDQWAEGGGQNYDAEGDTADDEPSLGSFDRMLDQSQWSRTTGGTSGGDLELDVSDREPSLGSLGHLDQTRWSAGDTRDREPNNDEIDYYSEERFIGNGCRLIPADALAVADARKRLGAIMDRVGGRR